jgi:hypothetical protein
VLVPMLASGGVGAPYDAVRDNLRFSADLGAFLTPSPLHPVWGRFLEPAYDTLRRDGSHTETVVFLGALTLVLAVLGSPTRRPQRFWLVAALIFLLLALGPVLHVQGHTVTVFGRPLALPFGLLLHAPVIGSTRAPARWTVMANLCLSVLAAGGTLRLLERFRDPRWTFLALTGALLFESAAVPFPFARPRALAGYERLAAEPGNGAVLEIPLHDDPGLVPQRMLFQTVHGKPVFGGYLSRGLPPLRFHAIPGFAQLQTLTPEVEDVVAYSPADLPALSRAALVEMGARFVVVDRGLLEPDTIAATRARMREIFGDLPRLYDGVDSIVYRLPAHVPAAPTFVFLDRGWYALERRPRMSPADHPARWRWIGERADLRLLAGAEGRWRLRLRAWAHERPRRLSLRLGRAPIGTFDVPLSLVTLETPEFQASAGSSVIEIRSLDGADRAGEDPRHLSVAVAEILLLPSKSEPSTSGPSPPGR